MIFCTSAASPMFSYRSTEIALFDAIFARSRDRPDERVACERWILRLTALGSYGRFRGAEHGVKAPAST